MADRDTPSYETDSVIEPTSPPYPTVTDTVKLPLDPLVDLHCIMLSEAHSLASHPVTPTRPLPLYPEIPRLPPDTVMVTPGPAMFVKGCWTASPVDVSYDIA
eukprot:3028137-Rhodomonas_salina.1